MQRTGQSKHNHCLGKVQGSMANNRDRPLRVGHATKTELGLFREIGMGFLIGSCQTPDPGVQGPPPPPSESFLQTLLLTFRSRDIKEREARKGGGGGEGVLKRLIQCDLL